MNPGKTMDTIELAPPVPLDLQRPLRFGLGALVIGVAVTLWWSAAVPLAEGVPAEGVVKTEGSRRSVQHARGGTLREILVRDGDTVRQGQPLLRLDDTDAKARLGMIEARWWPALAQEARLLAERDGLARVAFPSELRDSKADGAADAIKAQQRLFDARRAALAQDDVAQQVAVDSLRAYGSGLKEQSSTREEQIRSLNEELKTWRELQAQGYVARARLFEIERNLMAVQGQYSQDIGTLSRVEGSVAETQAKRAQRRSELRRDIETQLSDVQSRLAELREQRTALREELARCTLTAPVDGTVVDLAVHTEGGVATAGQKLMDLVPSHEALLVEAQVPVRLADGLVNGLQSQVRFTSRDQSLTKPAEGRVVYVAADRSADMHNPEGWYLVKVAVTPQALREAGIAPLQPGMPAQVMIATGQRSMLGYLLDPLTKRLNGVLAER
ncbi:MAG TPA: HlyD family type I secretion periplasmic adaptor subunit [Ideonella sp.]|uniref:HlyD family type I secretion periplasmic adaptor subunit n=1 Tax=Ideonella sp. TaxID=1929293 RepID=UPI002E33DF7C|nr:HlyD family type I secretion periplasmic adaptor subunit [Ideonella sp.]HEX5687130.1 HlyD family type I secretion periplasmic adaptor subunit [Ideonella sp.]